ncbi:hypothetical protein PCE1_003450 [Barthelona sp. PCE]
MSRHQQDTKLCGKQQANIFSVVCQRCSGKCIVCDSHVNLVKRAKMCITCATNQNESCVVCSTDIKEGDPTFPGEYCRECVLLERDKDGCPATGSVSITRIDDFYHKRRVQR